MNAFHWIFCSTHKKEPPIYIKRKYIQQMIHSICIEGNIGSGKSTLVHRLAEELSLRTLPEPVDEWSSVHDDDGKNIIERFYQDPKRNAHLFQSIAFRTRVKGLLAVEKGVPIITERSIFTDRNIFAKNLHEKGELTPIEWNDYDQWFHFITSSLKEKIVPDVYIYVRAEPKTCMERIKKRGRSGEDSISMEYLTELHIKHDEWLMREDSKKIFIIDANGDPYEEVKELILQLIPSHEDNYISHSEWC